MSGDNLSERLRDSRRDGTKRTVLLGKIMTTVDELLENVKAKQRTCQHEGFHANVAVNRIEDKGEFCADIRIACSQCGQPFMFLGLPPGLKQGGASCNITGEEAHLYIEPYHGEIFSGARFELKPEPEKH